MTNKIKYTCLVLLSVIVTIVIVELSLAPFVETKEAKRCVDCWEHQNLKDIGYWHKVNLVHWPKYYCEDNSLCYEVRYSYDSAGRRVVPNQKKSDTHVLFFGGSFAFGEGIEGEESLPAQVQELSDLKVYNYALIGAGAPLTAAMLESGKVKREVPEKRGVAFFVASDFQKYRGVISTFHKWCWDSPYYDYDDEGKIQNFGVQKEVHPNLVSIYYGYNQIKKHSNILRKVGLEFPTLNDDELTQRMVDTLKRAKEVYESQFDGEFIVILHPKYDSTKLQSFLLKEKIKFITYDFQEMPVEVAQVCKCNNHPSKAYNSVLAKKIAQTISTHFK